MKIKKYKKSRKRCGIIIQVLLICAMSALAQEKVLRDFSPEEYISLNKNVRISDALTIINGFSSRYENKIITDSKEHNGPINVVVDNMHWKRALEYILRSNGLAYAEHPRHYEIIDKNETKGSAEIEDHINLDTREIEIKAVFFEADYATLSEIGVDWTTLTDGKVKLRMDSHAGSQVSQSVFSVQAATQKFLNVSALIQAFESRDKGQVIANPQIRIMDGEEGKIKVGKNFFLTTRDFAGNTRYSEYEAGTILTVIPNIVYQDKQTFIHLDIMAEKSDVEVTSLGVTKRITEGRTQVLLLNGEETALAGLFSDQRANVRKGIPILKDLPWWFFGLKYITGYDSKSVTKKELVILIKPIIVPSLKRRIKNKLIRQNYLEQGRKELRNNMRKLSAGSGK